MTPPRTGLAGFLQRATLARTGIAVAVGGVVALAVHGSLHARYAQQQSDCAAWRRARAEITRGAPAARAAPVATASLERWLWDQLGDPEWAAVWELRGLLGQHPWMVPALVPALRDPGFVGLRHPGDVMVDGRDMPWYSHGMFVRDDLFRRAGRASWLLKQATGHPERIVRVDTDPVFLADLARDWERWLDGLDGGAACVPF